RIVDDPLRESDAPAGGAAAADERYVPAPVAPVLLRLRQPPHRPLETTPVAVPVPCQPLVQQVQEPLGTHQLALGHRPAALHLVVPRAIHGSSPARTPTCSTPGRVFSRCPTHPDRARTNGSISSRIPGESIMERFRRRRRSFHGAWQRPPARPPRGQGR